MALISHTSKVMLKILQTRLQQYMNRELPNVQPGFRKGEEPEMKLPTSTGSPKSKRVPGKHLLLLYWLHQSLWLCGSQHTVGNSERDHLTYLLRYLYAGQETTVRAGHGTTDWFQIGKGLYWGCILSHCLFNLYSEYTMRNAGLDEA